MSGLGGQVTKFSDSTKNPFALNTASEQNTSVFGSGGGNREYCVLSYLSKHKLK